MPNHVQNQIIFDCTEDRLKEIFKAIAKDKADDNIGHSGSGTIDFEKIIPMPGYIYRGDLGRAEFERYGTSNWYDWRIEHWGTKWNSYNCEGTDNTICFQTAWSAPHPILEKLADMFPDVSFKHRWADENLGDNCGEREYEGGECVSKYIPDGDVEATEFAMDVWNYDPEDIDLALNADGSKYINTDFDEYELIELFGKPALFSNGRITDKDIPKGFYHYDFRTSDDGENPFAALETYVAVNHGGSVITSEPIDLGGKGCIELTEDTEPNFIGTNITLGQYMYGDFNMEMGMTQ